MNWSFLSAGLVAFFAASALPNQAHAQAAGDETGGKDGTAAARTDDTGVLTLDPITVTARRRSELAQEAPVSLSVIESDDIGIGMTDTFEDAALRSPNTLFNAQGGPLTIRGIGSLGIDGGVDRQPSVGVFVDDVYIARPFGYPQHLQDLERVEVVRGSQATLYGKNTIGGAINLVTRDPEPTFGVETTGTIGSGRDPDTLSSRLAASFDTSLTEPGSDSDLALRGFTSWSGSNGYIENSDGELVSDTNSLATRLVLKGTLGELTDLRIAADYSRNRDDGGLWYAPLPLAFDYKADHDYDPENNLDIAGISVRIDHDLEDFTLTSVTAFRGHEMDAVLDGDFTSLPFLGQAQTESQRQLSQELRFATDGARDIVLRGGLFYMHEWFEGDQFFDLASVPRDLWSRTTFDQETDTYSAFAEVSYDLTPELELIGGLRYTYERKEATSELSSPSGTFMFGAPGLAKGTESFDNLSPEVSLVYHLDERNLAFAKVSRGFKSGGISPFIDIDNSPNLYDPELTTSYEIGAKTSLLDNRLTVNASAFYIDWEDQQAVIYTSPFTRVIRNAAAASSTGFELEGAALLSEGLTVTANYGYLHAEYDDFVDQVLGADHSGNALPYAPEHSAGFGLRWTAPVDAGTDFVSGFDYAYRSSYAFSADNDYRQDATHLLDARVGLQGEHWGASLWAKNLLDEQYLRQYFDYAGTDMGVAAEGFTFGLTVSASW